MASVSRNSLYLLSGSVVQKILAFIYFIFLARFLGPDSVGKYTFAISFVGIFSIFIDWGLNQLLIRESAKDQHKADFYFHSILALKLISSAIIYLLIIVLIRTLPYPEVTRQLVYLAGLVMVLDNFSNTNYSVLRGFQNLKYEGMAAIFYQAIVLVVGLVVLFLHLPLPYLMIPLLLASTFNVIFGLIFLWRGRRIKLAFNFDSCLAKNLFKITQPFFWAGLFGTVFSFVDVVLLSRLAGDQAVGFYSAAGKIPSGLRMFPIAFASALYPAATFYFTNNRDELKRILQEFLFYLLLFVLPLIVGLWVLAEPAISILYGHKFLDAVPSLRILTWSMLFVFLDYVFFVVLNACGQEKKNVSNRAVAMFLIIVLNLALIPTFKQIGSSIAFTLSYAALAGLGAWWTKKIIRFSLRPLAFKTLKILMISLVMGAVMLFLKAFFVWPILVLVGVVVYILGICLVGLINREDIRYFKTLLGFFKKSSES